MRYETTMFPPLLLLLQRIDIRLSLHPLSWSPLLYRGACGRVGRRRGIDNYRRPAAVNSSITLPTTSRLGIDSFDDSQSLLPSPQLGHVPKEDTNGMVSRTILSAWRWTRAQRSKRQEADDEVDTERIGSEPIRSLLFAARHQQSGLPRAEHEGRMTLRHHDVSRPSVQRYHVLR